MGKKGSFIVFEGIDGCGKSSQLKLAEAYCREKGMTVVVSREPGGTGCSEAVRSILLDPAYTGMSHICELMLYGASRAEHIKDIIAPALDKGYVVLCDRFALSTVAYQGYGRGIDLEEINAVNQLAVGNYTPDLTLVFDIPLSVANERMAVRGGDKDRLEQEKAEFFAKVRRGYLDAALKDDYRNIKIIDGTPDEDTVFASVKKELEKIL